MVDEGEQLKRLVADLPPFQSGTRSIAVTFGTSFFDNVI